MSVIIIKFRDMPASIHWPENHQGRVCMQTGDRQRKKISNPVYSAKWCLPDTRGRVARIIYGGDSQRGKGRVVAINAARLRKKRRTKKKANLGGS